MATRPDANVHGERTATTGTPGTHGGAVTDGLLRDSAFVGRDVELAALRQGLRAASRGEGNLILIGGEPGIGKTRLAEQISIETRAAMATVLWGRCWEGEGAPAFWPWIQILRGCLPDPGNRTHTPLEVPELRRVLEDLGARLPPTQSLESEQSRLWLFDLMFNALRRAITAEPLLIVLDDLHWADPASFLLLQFIAGEISTTPLLIVGTYRDVGLAAESPIVQMLASVSRHRWSRRLSLEGLSSDDVGRLLELLTHVKPTDHMINLIRERTGGNPFFLTETVSLLVDGGCRDDAEGRILRQVPDTVREALERRMKGLPRPSIRVLQRAALIGTEFDLDLLAEQIEQTTGETLEVLEHAIAAKLVLRQRTFTRFRFAHALVREVLYDQISASHREGWHAQLAISLEERYAADGELPLAAIAHHCALAGSAGDPQKAFMYSIRAGEQAAAAFAYEDASSHFARALAGADAIRVDPLQRCELLLALGESHQRSGDWEQSRAAFRQAAFLAQRIDKSMLLTRAAIGFYSHRASAPIDEEAVALLQAALSAVGPDDSRSRVEILAALTFCLHFGPDPAVRLALSAEAMAIAQRIGDRSLLAEACETQINALVGRCSPGELAQLATETIQLAKQCTDQGREFRCRMFHFMALLQMGRRTEAEAELGYCTQLAKSSHYPKYLWQVAAANAGRAITRGQFDLAHQLIEEAQRVGRRFDGPIADAYRFIQETVLVYTRGEIASVEATLFKWVEAYPDVALAHAALAAACAAAGHVPEAREALDWFGSAELQGISGVFGSFTLALLAEAASAVKDESRSRTLYQTLLPKANENFTCSYGFGLVGSVSHYLGLLSASLDQFDEAAEHFEDALTMNSHMRAPALIACSRRSYAEMLLRRNRVSDHSRARELLEKVISTSKELNMTGNLEGAKRTLALLHSGTATVEPCVAQFDGDAATAPPREDSPFIFRREADFWTIAFESSVSRLRHTRGLAILSILLQRPGTEVHVLDLVDAVDTIVGVAELGQRGRSGRPRKAVHPPQSDAGLLLDARARAEYRNRVKDLGSELAEAEHFNDAGRVNRLRAEIEFLVAELNRVYGRGGRLRVAAATTERARINVRNNLSTALKIIKRSNSALCRHLESALRTGTFCSYKPERPVSWVF